MTDTAGPTTWSASSSRFRTFATVFAISSTVLYIFCEMANLPTFTYHPGTGRIEWGWAAAIKDEGPAMYWYGWLVTTFAGAAAISLVATELPQQITKRIPLALVWIVPLLAVPILVYALRFFWRW
jgi:hypothetical protein